MPPRRSFVPISLAALVAACAPVHTQRAPAPAPEITLQLASSPARAHDQLLTAFAAQGLPVATSQPGVIEFQGPRERGILGFDEVFARAIIVPLECGTRVTLFGEETHYPNAFAREGRATRIGPSSRGRARDVWDKLQTIANTLRADSAATRTRT
jgi:hypothetical protein